MYGECWFTGKNYFKHGGSQNATLNGAAPYTCSEIYRHRLCGFVSLFRLRSQVVYSKQPKLGQTQEFVHGFKLYFLIVVMLDGYLCHAMTVVRVLFAAGGLWTCFGRWEGSPTPGYHLQHSGRLLASSRALTHSLTHSLDRW